MAGRAGRYHRGTHRPKEQTGWAPPGAPCASGTGWVMGRVRSEPSRGFAVSCSAPPLSDGLHFLHRAGRRPLSSILRTLRAHAPHRAACDARAITMRARSAIRRQPPRSSSTAIPGTVLHASNAEALRHPASLTKIMTLYLLFERLEAGKIKLDTPLEDFRARRRAVADETRREARPDASPSKMRSRRW